jgi:multidrug resistance efflux pump
MVLTLARLELAAGDPVAAERALDLIYLGRDGLFYRAEADELRAASAQARGDRETARRALQSMLSLWAGADAELQPRVASARAELARLGN